MGPSFTGRAEIMANPEHVEVVKQGANAIAKWHHSNPTTILNLNRAVLSGVDLTNADLTRAFLVGAILADANLTGANLAKADLAKADLRRANLSWVDFTRARLTGANLIEVNLSRTTLIEAKLFRANLRRANLNCAILTGADLTKADLTGAILTAVNLTKADLSRANLSGVNLTKADLTGACLVRANLRGANLEGANLTGADLTDARRSEKDRAGGGGTAGLDSSSYGLHSNFVPSLNEANLEGFKPSKAQSVQDKLSRVRNPRVHIKFDGLDPPGRDADQLSAFPSLSDESVAKWASVLTRAKPRWFRGALTKLATLVRTKRRVIGDQVDCTVFAPETAFAGESLLVQILIHQPEQAQHAEAEARECDNTAQKRGFTSLQAEVERGSRLDIHVTLDGAVVDPPTRSVTWNGRYQIIGFQVALSAGCKLGTHIGTVHVYQEGIPIGEIRLKLDVVERQQVAAVLSEPKPEIGPVGDAMQFNLYFVSYASQDRSEVLKRVHAILRVGKRVFQDVLSLDPGDRWEQKLYKHIDECDAVLLFWSSNAKRSEWVIKECVYAIEKKGIDRLKPIPIEGPPPVEPPPELAALHMNDPLLYFIKAEEASR